MNAGMWAVTSNMVSQWYNCKGRTLAGAKLAAQRILAGGGKYQTLKVGQYLDDCSVAIRAVKHGLLAWWNE